MISIILEAAKATVDLGLYIHGMVSQRKEIKLMTYGERTQHTSRMRNKYFSHGQAFDAAVPVKED